jgi:hypothetical protein
VLPVNGSLHMAPLFPRSGPGESSSPMSQVVLRCYDFPSRLSGRLFVSLPGSTLPSSVRVSQLAPRSRKDGGCLPGRGHCSAGDPIAGLLSRGRERDLPGFQAIHPVPLPRSRTPAESTSPRLLTVPSMLPPLVRQRRLQRINHIGAIARLQHLLPTLQEWCCHRPCKARFRPAGSPLPGGSRTLWITTKGFRSLLVPLFWTYPGATYGGFSISTAGRLAVGTVPSWVMGGLSLLPAFAVRHPVCIRFSCTSWSLRWSALSRA